MTGIEQGKYPRVAVRKCIEVATQSRCNVSRLRSCAARFQPVNKGQTSRECRFVSTSTKCFDRDATIVGSTAIRHRGIRRNHLFSDDVFRATVVVLPEIGTQHHWPAGGPPFTSSRPIDPACLGYPITGKDYFIHRVFPQPAKVVRHRITECAGQDTTHWVGPCIQ